MNQSYSAINNSYIRQPPNNNKQSHIRQHSNFTNIFPPNNNVIQFKNSFGNHNIEKEGRKTFTGRDKPDFFKTNPKYNKVSSMSMKNLNNFGYLTDNNMPRPPRKSLFNRESMATQQSDYQNHSNFKKKYTQRVTRTMEDPPSVRHPTFSSRKNSMIRNKLGNKTKKNKKKNKKDKIKVSTIVHSYKEDKDSNNLYKSESKNFINTRLESQKDLLYQPDEYTDENVTYVHSHKSPYYSREDLAKIAGGSSNRRVGHKDKSLFYKKCSTMVTNESPNMQNMAQLEYKYSPLEISQNTITSTVLPEHNIRYSNHPVVNKYLQSTSQRHSISNYMPTDKNSNNESNLYSRDSYSNFPEYPKSLIKTSFTPNHQSKTTINKANYTPIYDYETQKQDYTKKMNDMRLSHNSSNRQDYINLMPDQKDRMGVQHKQNFSINIPSHLKSHTKNKYSMNSHYRTGH